MSVAKVTEYALWGYLEENVTSDGYNEYNLESNDNNINNDNKINNDNNITNDDNIQVTMEPEVELRESEVRNNSMVSYNI